MRENPISSFYKLSYLVLGLIVVTLSQEITASSLPVLIFFSYNEAISALVVKGAIISAVSIPAN